MWWLSLDGQFRLPFNEADCALLSALASPESMVGPCNGQTVSANLALDPRIFLLAAAGHYGMTGRTPRQLGQLVNWLAVARKNEIAQLQPISRRRRKLMRQVQKHRERYLRHLRGGSDVFELRRQLEKLLRNCGKYPGNWKATKLVNRWVCNELLSELAELNPLELAAKIIFPKAKATREVSATSAPEKAIIGPTSSRTEVVAGCEKESLETTQELLSSQSGTTWESEQSPKNLENHAEQIEVVLQPVRMPTPPLDPSAYQKLLQTEKLAALRQLAYGASHEINNPLANIAMRAEMLLRGEADPDRQRKLQVIRQQAMRAHEMISDLMLFANPPRPNLQSIDLAKWLAELVEELKTDVQLSGGELVVEKASQPTIIGDPVQLAEAVRALVRNGLEAQPANARIRVVAGVDAQGDAFLEVSDDGPGISDDIARHMFDPFFSGREAGRGLGFGLPKAWRIAESHGGQLACLARSPGKTVFRLSWPPLQAPPARAA